MRFGIFSNILLAYPPPQGYPPPPGYLPPPGYPPPPGQPGERSGKLTAAGILNIVGGVIALIVFIVMISMYFAAIAEAEDAYDEADVDVEGFGGLFALGAICFVFVLIGAIFSIISGVFALKQKSYSFCLVGSIIGLIFGGGILQLIALILIATSKEEFYS
jgi:hypothetical protein